MHKPVSVTIPFVSPAGTSGVITLQHDGRCGDKAHLAIGMGCPISGVKAAAPLALNDMRELVNGLMDSIQAIERNIRLKNKDL